MNRELSKDIPGPLVGEHAREIQIEVGSIGNISNLLEIHLHTAPTYIKLIYILLMLYNNIDLFLQKSPTCLSKQLGYALSTYLLLCQNIKKSKSWGRWSLVSLASNVLYSLYEDQLRSFKPWNRAIYKIFLLQMYLQ